MNDHSDQLIEHILDIRTRLNREEYDNEVKICDGIVKRLLADLGWPLFETEVVSPQFKIESGTERGYVDFALCHPPKKPLVFLEVKVVGSADQKGEDQLFRYCYREGVKLAILTDGCTWKFYYPYGGGQISDRLFRQFDIVAGDATIIAETLQWFLDLDAVKSGIAYNRCENAYTECQSQRKAAEAFDSVWNALLCESDKRLVDIFTRKVEENTGIRPKQNAVVEFLRKQATQPLTELTGPPPTDEKAHKGEALVTPFFTLNGVTTQFKTGKEVFVAIFREFAKRDNGFCKHYANTQRTGGKRLELARRAEDLYPPGSKWARTDASELPGGRWLATHLSDKLKEKRIQRACDVTGIMYGRDLTMSLSK